MSHQWVRAANAIGNYRWSLDPAPTDTAFTATNWTFAIRRWVRGHAVQLAYGVLIAAGLTIGGLIP